MYKYNIEKKLTNNIILSVLFVSTMQIVAIKFILDVETAFSGSHILWN